MQMQKVRMRFESGSEETCFIATLVEESREEFRERLLSWPKEGRTFNDFGVIESLAILETTEDGVVVIEEAVA